MVHATMIKILQVRLTGSCTFVVSVASTNEGVLEATLSRFGHVIHATIRQVDEAGNNTSWALVTMSTTDEANKVLRAVDSLPPPLTVQPFSQNQADKSLVAYRTFDKHH